MHAERIAGLAASRIYSRTCGWLPTSHVLGQMLVGYVQALYALWSSLRKRVLVRYRCFNVGMVPLARTPAVSGSVGGTSGPSAYG